MLHKSNKYEFKQDLAKPVIHFMKWELPEKRSAERIGSKGDPENLLVLFRAVRGAGSSLKFFSSINT